MSIYIPADLRQLVINRASGCCEYCLLHQDETEFTHPIDHVIPVKHKGQTISENLALACLKCNRHKGSDIAAIDQTDGAIVPLYNPRTQIWSEHFQLEGAIIRPLTPQGRVTTKMLHFNDVERVEERERLMIVKLYP